nr:zinc finger BED domain-containing protein RICESLEEPER 2-like [Tanacetum cinerariifolium]
MTRVFQNHLQLKYTHVSRTTLKRDAKKLRKTAKQQLIDGFLNLNASVNITTDVWSAPHGLPGSYLYVTAHWIEPETWQMMKRVIVFEEFPIPHTGVALFQILRKAFVKFHLEEKNSIKFDSASNNKKAIGRLHLIKLSWASLDYSNIDGMTRFKKKLQDLKVVIRRWVNTKRLEMVSSKLDTIAELEKIDKAMDIGVVDDCAVLRRGDFDVSVVRHQTCLTDILGFLEKFKGAFEQDIDDEGEEDKEDEEGDGEV